MATLHIITIKDGTIVKNEVQDGSVDYLLTKIGGSNFKAVNNQTYDKPYVLKLTQVGELKNYAWINTFEDPKFDEICQLKALKKAITK